MRRPIIAIDGPAGAGKSTIAQITAEQLGYLYIDTGAMYRAAAVKVLAAGLSVQDVAGVSQFVSKLDIRFETVSGEKRIFVGDEDVTESIRSAEATRLSSPLSAIAGVRKRMVELQRKMAEAGGVVMEGRDIGTVVFPDAEVKIFLTASITERARRRTAQLRERGTDADVDVIAEEIRERDLRDSSREHAPLRQAHDAVLVDTDKMQIDEVVREVIAIHNQKLAYK